MVISHYHHIKSRKCSNKFKGSTNVVLGQLVIYSALAAIYHTKLTSNKQHKARKYMRFFNRINVKRLSFSVYINIGWITNSERVNPRYAVTV